METNNKIQLFSTTTNNVYSDTDMQESAVQTIVKTGAVFNNSASSKLYNSLSKSLSLPVVALVDYVAKQNPTITFGQALDIDSWISAFQNSFASYKDTQNSITAINTNITNIVNGTTTVGKATNATNATNATDATNATNVTTTINGKNISDIFAADGVTIKNSQKAQVATNSIKVALGAGTNIYGGFKVDSNNENLKAYGFESTGQQIRDVFTSISIWNGEITNGETTSNFSVNLRDGDEIEIEYGTPSDVNHKLATFTLYGGESRYCLLEYIDFVGSNVTNGHCYICRANITINNTNAKINSVTAYDAIAQEFSNNRTLTIYRINKVYRNYTNIS